MLYHFIVFTLLLCTISAHATPIEKVLSLNLCADIVLLHLADSEQQLSVTFLARDMPPYVTLPQSVEFNRGLIEEVVVFKPHIVLAHTFTSSLLLQNLKQLDLPVVKLKAAQNMDDIYQNLMDVGEAINKQQKAQQIVAQMQQTLKQLPQFSQQSVLVFYPNGFTVGQQTLVSHVVTKLGLNNLADKIGIQFWGKITLEQILQHQPHFIILSKTNSQAPALATRLLQHSSLQKQAYIEIDNRLWHCGTPLIMKAMQQIAQRLMIIDEYQ